MQFIVPVYVSIDAQDQNHANTQKQAIESLLRNGMIAAVMASSGINFQGVQVVEAYVPVRR